MIDPKQVRALIAQCRKEGFDKIPMGLDMIEAMVNFIERTESVGTKVPGTDTPLEFLVLGVLVHRAGGSIRVPKSEMGQMPRELKLWVNWDGDDVTLSLQKPEEPS